jgi:hypothetical protein
MRASRWWSPQSAQSKSFSIANGLNPEHTPRVDSPPWNQCSTTTSLLPATQGQRSTDTRLMNDWRMTRDSVIVSTILQNRTC